MTILTAVTIRLSGQLRKMQTCLSSWRRHNPEARIVVCNSSPDHQDLSDLLFRYGAESVDVTRWESVPWHLLDIPNLFYRRWLRVAGSIGPVIIPDAFDVVAQQPLDGLPAYRLTVSQENHLIRDCPYNSTWLHEGFGVPLDAPIMAQPIICQGVILGTPETLLPYLDWYRQTLHSLPPIEMPRNQAAMNLYASYPEHDVQVLPYANPSVMHLGYGDPLTLRWKRVGIEYNGMQPRLVHQFNRHLPLLRALRRAYA